MIDDELLPEGLLMLEPRDLYDRCFVGVGRRFDHTFAVYSIPCVLEAIASESDDDEPMIAAREHFEYNMVTSWVGDDTWGFITPVDDL